MQGILSHAANSEAELRLKNLSRKVVHEGVNFSMFFQQPNIESRE